MNLCPGCGEEMAVSKNPGNPRKTCSPRCAARVKSGSRLLPDSGWTPTPGNCEACGEEFMPRAQGGGKARRFCSRECQQGVARRDYMLRSVYGITETEWETLFDAQGRRCVFGCDHPGHAKGWVTDHDHETGKVRGILCYPHNIALGFIERHRGEMFDLLAYVEKHKDPEAGDDVGSVPGLGTTTKEAPNA